MNYKFKAEHVFFEDDGDLSIVGFANDKFTPSQFVIFQQAHEYDEQDKNLGMDKTYIQVDDESKSQYGGITEINTKENKLIIHLDKSSRDNLKVDGDIEIILDLDDSESAIAIEKLKKMIKRDLSKT